MKMESVITFFYHPSLYIPVFYLKKKNLSGQFWVQPSETGVFSMKCVLVFPYAS